MKKNDLKTLKLNKKAISKLEEIKGGLENCTCDCCTCKSNCCNPV